MIKSWEYVDTDLLVPGFTFIVYGRELTDINDEL